MKEVSMRRRTVLKGAAMTVIAAGVGPAAFFGGPIHAAGAYRRADFEALVGQRFYVDGGAAPRLDLLEVSDGPQAPGYDQFVLIFRGDADLTLDDVIHQLTPEGGSAMDLFLTSAGEDAGGRYFTAAFAIDAPVGSPGCAGTTIG